MTHQKTNSSILLLFLLFLLFQNTVAQERQILQGQIIVDSIQNASGVHVINLNAETGTTTDIKGEFKILAKPGDSIFFSSVQFENRNFVVKNASLEGSLKIRLINKFNELDEVQLDDIKLSGVLSEDVTRMPKSIYEKLGMPFPKPRRTSLELAIQSASGGGPLVSVLNRLNGTTEQLEKAEKNNQLSILVNKGLNLVGKSFFVGQLKIPENEIMNFIFYCAEDEQYKKLVLAESTLQLVEFFNKKIDSFKELRELD